MGLETLRSENRRLWDAGACIHRSESKFKSLRDLWEEFPDRRPYVIDGLLRRGEVMNIVGAPKSNKSWLSLNVIMSIAMGSPLFDYFACVRGRAAIIDNELHSEEGSFRTRTGVDAFGIPREAIQDNVDFLSVRGRLMDLNRLWHELENIPPSHYTLIVLDALYRFMPKGLDENDNGAMAEIYNTLDGYARYLNSSIVVIHHSTKGNQAYKNVTDVGAGAGAQSRAADTHLVLRAHEEKNCAVLEAAVRSSPPVSALGLRFDFPVWRHDKSVDVTKLAGTAGEEKPYAAGPSEEQKERMTEKYKTELQNAEEKIITLLKAQPLSWLEVKWKLGNAGVFLNGKRISESAVKALVKAMQKDGKIEEIKEGKNTVYRVKEKGSPTPAPVSDDEPQPMAPEEESPI